LRTPNPDTKKLLESRFQELFFTHFLSFHNNLNKFFRSSSSRTPASYSKVRPAIFREAVSPSFSDLTAYNDKRKALTWDAILFRLESRTIAAAGGHGDEK